jgi:enamine deaminase RidA (YjgF/YER057c/UK114 family)
LPIVPDAPDRKLASFDEQARQVIDNVSAILEEVAAAWITS